VLAHGFIDTVGVIVGFFGWDGWDLWELKKPRPTTPPTTKNVGVMCYQGTLRL